MMLNPFYQFVVEFREKFDESTGKNGYMPILLRIYILTSSLFALTMFQPCQTSTITLPASICPTMTRPEARQADTFCG
jgi:hypothetical protein